MSERFFLGALVLAVGVAVALPLTASAAGPSGSASEMTQFDVAVEIFQAVDVNHGSPTPAEAMLMLQARGLVPQSWDGVKTVTMGEVGQIMNQMGIEVGISNPSDAVGAGNLEKLLKTYQTEIGRVSRDLSDGEQLPKSSVLSVGDRRIVSASEF